ncbi:hypothetical protein NIES25_22020 [Nostoc linckia NIES-25]|nr:hypothetical protein NIES25_22020 [Nostoc linckia NIES-25]
MSQKKRFLLRLDLELYEVLEKWSADELRSVNAQIEYLLTEAARKTGRWKESNTKKNTKRQTKDTQMQDKSDD